MMDFAHRVKIEESEKRDKYLDLARELKKNMEYDGDTNCGWCAWNNSQKIAKERGRLGNKKTSRDHQEYSITKIGQNTENTEKSPEDLKRLVVTQIPVRNHRLTLI